MSSLAGGDPFSSSPSKDRIPFRQVGSYRLLGLLGEGPGSSRYLCRKDDLSPLRALELLPSGLEPAARESLRRAAEEAGRLSHPGLLQPLEVGEHHGRMFLVTEHVKGPTLAERLEREGALPLPEALEVTFQLLEAVAAAHSRGVLHLAIEPGLVILDANTGRPRLTGFGLGTVAAAVRLTSSARDGPPPRGLYYQAPELLSSHLPPDARADVFSLGVLAYELVARARPFTARNTAELLERLRVGGAQPPTRRVPELDPRLDQALLAPLAPNPQGRPRNAGAFLQVLRAAVRVDEPAPRLGAAPPLLAVAAGLAVGCLLAVWPLVGLGRARAQAGRDLSAARDQREALSALQTESARLDAAEAEARGQAAQRQETLQGDQRQQELAREQLAATLAYSQLVRRVRARPRVEIGRAAAGVLQALRHLPETASLRARWLLHLGAVREALEAVDAARAAGSADPDLPVYEFMAWLASGETERARERLEELAKGADTPQGLWARSFDQRLGAEERIAILEEAIERRPDAGYLRSGLHRALDANQRGQLQERSLRRGLEAAEAGLRLDPADTELLFQRSSDRFHLWLLSGRRDAEHMQAFMADLARARAIVPRSHLWTYSAKTWCFLRRPGCALVEANQAVELADRGAPAEQGLARVWQGLALFQLGRPDEAARAWEVGLERGPNPEFGQALGELEPAQREALFGRLSPAAQQRLRALLGSR